MIKKLALLVATLCGSALTAADLSISYVFTDHMVLQREKPVAVWGWANAGETVTVEFADQKNTTVAGPDGKWLLYLSPMPASFESRVIKISGSNPAADTSKPRSIEIKDVLVGEVWLGSGQSNMELGVDYCLNAKEEVANANYPNIRFFFEHSKHQNDPQANGKGNWIACSPKTVGYFSGTLYFMGRQLHKELNVPIGLINSSQGGTKIESWMSLEAQHSDDFLKQHYEALVQYGKEVTSEESRKKFLEELKAWYVADEKAKAEGKPSPNKPYDAAYDLEIKGPPCGLFNGKINPLIPYTIRGVLWYQGEANAWGKRPWLYTKQLSTLIYDWRKRWGEELPFAWVQLPGFKANMGEGWQYMRESMLKALVVPKTGMVVAIDVGEENNIHPQNKQVIGQRFALWALGEVYGKEVAETSGPLPQGSEIQGDKVIVSFRHASGLRARDGQLKGFTIAGPDQNFVPAQATIENDKVIVYSPDIKNPVAVRYAWSEVPECNLVNGAGLPASPFRTDGGN